MRVDVAAGCLEVLVDPDEWTVRTPTTADFSGRSHGLGRELFGPSRAAVGRADEGAAVMARRIRPPLVVASLPDAPPRA